MRSGKGIIHGRFQPPHHGHMEYLLSGLSRCDYLLIGLTNPDPTMVEDHAADRDRSSPHANPFTYYERFKMVKAAMLERGVPRSQFAIIPFPINKPDLLEHYVPDDGTYFITIYDEWGEVKEELLEEQGFNVEIMWEREMSERLTSGTQVRKFMSENKAWEALVPEAVETIIKKNSLNERVKKMNNSHDRDTVGGKND